MKIKEQSQQKKKNLKCILIFDIIIRKTGRILRYGCKRNHEERINYLLQEGNNHHKQKRCELDIKIEAEQ